MLCETLYHRSLRVLGVVLACALVFQSGVVVPETSALSNVLSDQFASVIGISASVQPTELSELTAELTKRQRDLSLREAELTEREIALGAPSATHANLFQYVVSAMLALILTLLIANYIFDYLRARKLTALSYG